MRQGKHDTDFPDNVSNSKRKNMPGCFMAAARHNRPTIIVYGGTIQAGTRHVGESAS
jgi:hypothetical protein